jgi:hypothetical protein
MTALPTNPSPGPATGVGARPGITLMKPEKKNERRAR